MTYLVNLANVGNIDHDENPFAPLPGTTTYKASVQSLEEAVVVCRQYIEYNELGGGNWIGGQVTNADTGEHVAYISYNGRAWQSIQCGTEILVDNTVIAELLTPRIYYHVTPFGNIDSILREGLLPLTGERSIKIGEIEPAVYLFESFAACEDALMGWLGEEFEDYGKLVVFEINLPRCMEVVTSAADYEVLVKQPIPSNCIHIKQFA